MVSDKYKLNRKYMMFSTDKNVTDTVPEIL